jgi:uncharacterized membrane protein
MAKGKKVPDNSGTKRGTGNLLRRLASDFLHGLIIILPLAVTLWLIIWLFNLIDGMLAPVLQWAFGRPMPGLGFVIIIILVTIIGFFGVRIGRRRFFALLEARIIRIPAIGGIYGSIRQMLNSFASNTPRKFLEVVLMEFPRKGVYTVGLVTGEVKDKNGMKLLNVFVPTAPNPVGGFLQIVPDSEVIRTSMSIDDAMKLIISAGKISPDDISDVLSQLPKPQSKGTFN